MSNPSSSATWPNAVWWNALEDGKLLTQNYVDAPDTRLRLRVVDCGRLALPSGRLVACDPFGALQPENNPHIKLPPGRYSVLATQAHITAVDGRSRECTAYLTLILNDAPELERRVLVQLTDSERVNPTPLESGEILGSGFGVDSGIACFVDDGALKDGMPDATTWQAALFSPGTANSWLDRLYDRDDNPTGPVNVPLPLATDGANIILVHSGFGDGGYAVVGGYGADGQLVRVHIDFSVVEDPDG